MLRLFFLTISVLVIFSGIVLPVLRPGWDSYIMAVLLLILGGILLFLVEKKTRHHLEEDSLFNWVMTAEERGEAERDEKARRQERLDRFK